MILIIWSIKEVIKEVVEMVGGVYGT